MTADGTPGSGRHAHEFTAFVKKHARSLDRLAYLMVGDEHAGEDLAADALMAAWRDWDRVRQVDHPVAYVRGIMVNQVSGHFRRRARESRLVGRLKIGTTEFTREPDGAAVVDVRTALLRLPPRRRACLVLRHAFQLTESEVADTLGISIGTVKSQTSKAAAQFRRELGDVAPTLSAALGSETLRATGQRKAKHAG